MQRKGTKERRKKHEIIEKRRRRNKRVSERGKEKEREHIVRKHTDVSGSLAKARGKGIPASIEISDTFHSAWSNQSLRIWNNHVLLSTSVEKNSRPWQCVCAQCRMTQLDTPYVTMWNGK